MLRTGAGRTGRAPAVTRSGIVVTGVPTDAAQMSCCEPTGDDVAGRVGPSHAVPDCPTTCRERYRMLDARPGRQAAAASPPDVWLALPSPGQALGLLANDTP